MGETDSFDIAVVGGGVMGCTAALYLARGGMRTVLFERGGLCREASGRNAGTLTMLYTRASLIPYAMRGRELWRDSRDWLDGDAGFHFRHGLELVFTQEDADRLAQQMKKRAEAGAPIEMIGGNRAREVEPALSREVVAGAYCLADGYAHSYLIGDLFHTALRKAQIDVRSGQGVLGIEADGDLWRVRAAKSAARTRCMLLTGGAWIGKMARWFGLEFPMACRVNQGNVSERLPPTFKSIIRVPNILSLKQTENGSVLMGGGKQEHWVEDPDKGDEQQNPFLVKDKMIASAEAACRVIPALRAMRVLRSWTGYEAFTPDNQPLIGPMPGAENVYVLGCLRSGFTIGPFAGKLVAEVLLGREPEMPLFLPEFDPKRVIGMKPFDTSQPAQAA